MCSPAWTARRSATTCCCNPTRSAAARTFPPVWDVGEMQGGFAVMAYGMRLTFAYVAQTQEFQRPDRRAAPVRIGLPLVPLLMSSGACAGRPLLPGQSSGHQRGSQARQAGDVGGGVDRQHRAASAAARSAPRTVLVRPANLARSSASDRKLDGSPFGTTTFCSKRLAARLDGQLAGHVGREFGLDLRVERAGPLSAAASGRWDRSAARSCPSPSPRSPARRRSRTAR